MYVPEQFSERRIDVLQALMHDHPLATLVTVASHGLEANHIPLLVRQDGAGFGTLVGHVARANPVWRDTSTATEVLAIFQGPQAYISPNWYPTKQETGKGVPTWNYAVVHAHGPLRIIDDTAWLRAHLALLTDRQEQAYATPWRLDEAPADYIEQLSGAIVGIEIPITRLVGKWKVSQNQPDINRQGVMAALDAQGTDQARAMSALVQGFRAQEKS